VAFRLGCEVGAIMEREVGTAVGPVVGFAIGTALGPGSLKKTGAGKRGIKEGVVGSTLGSEVILIPDGTPVGEFADPGGPDNFSGFDSMDGNTFKVGPPIGILVTETGVDNTGITAVAAGCICADTAGEVVTGEMVPVTDQIAGAIDTLLRMIPFVGCNVGFSVSGATFPLGRVLGSKVIFRPDDTPVGKLADPGRLNKFA
jgi:hypothetical protein